MFKQKKFIAVLAPVGMLAGMVMATQAVAMSHGGSKYLDSSKQMVTNSAGECWQTVGGTPGPQEQCGDSNPSQLWSLWS